ncbi:MAG: class II glutamine amidotransferase [Actinomycetota bacterium]|nr:class II glutamine amidotransferase [Actinomycetota bacterium]
MCRLFGVLANSPVNIQSSLLNNTNPFIRLSHKHNDGWGIGYLDYYGGRKSARIIKAPHPAYRDKYFIELIKNLTSPLVIIHLRDAKYGEVAIENTQPFYSHGWMFAHNGAIKDYREIDNVLADVNFEGETDSERYFQLILKHIKEQGNAREGIISAICWLEGNHFEGAKNFLLSDGERLYAYRDGRTLFYTKTNNKARTKKAVIVASEILTQEKWHEIPEGCLVVIEKNLQVTVSPRISLKTILKSRISLPRF